MYWDYKRVLEKKCLFNFILGARGVGKTYGCKMWAIDDFLSTGSQFVYLRRFKSELKSSFKFFDDILDRYPTTEFKLKGKAFTINGEEAGFYMSLSTAKTNKSVAYPKVNKIIFDEFILDKGMQHYLPDEVTNFLECYSTIARDRDVTVMFVSNAITFTNPYFLYFDLELPYKTEFKAKNDCCIQIIKDTEYAEHMKSTRFGKLIAGTEYGAYAIDNQFLRDNKNFVERKTGKVGYFFTMIYRGTTYGVWIDRPRQILYVSLDVDKSCGVFYSLDMDDHTPDRQLIKKNSSPLFKYFIESYKQGYVRFESVKIKNMCHELIRLTL